MKKWLYIFITAVFVCGCSSQKEEQQRVYDTINQFYSALNDRDFKSMEEVCSSNMSHFVKTLRKEKHDLIKYKKYSVSDIEIISGSARAEVECTDEYGNVIVMNWDLIKQNNQWKINNYNNSQAKQQYNTTVSDTSKSSSVPAVRTSTQTTEIKQENEDADQKDSLYN